MWPLIDGVRTTEVIAAELSGVLDLGTVKRVLSRLGQMKFILLEDADLTARTLSLYSFNRLTNPVLSPSLMSGSAGESLYFLSEAVSQNDEKILSEGRQQLMRSLSEIHKVIDAASFYEGPLGILWMENLWKKKTGEEILEMKSLAPFLRNYFTRHSDLADGRFEYLYGTSGWALAAHFLDRKSLQVMSKIIVDQIVRSLEPSASGVVLRGVDDLRNFQDPTTPRAKKTHPGLAHGVAGALTALNVLRSLDALSKKDHDLISWLSDALLVFDEEFPMPKTFEEPHLHDRQDWCHGDGGIGLTFLSLGGETGNIEFQNRGHKLMARALAVATREKDPGLCHGTGGKLALATIAGHYSGRYQKMAAGLKRDLKQGPELVGREFFRPGMPLINSALGTAISMNAVQGPDFLSFYYPLVPVK